MILAALGGLAIVCTACSGNSSGANSSTKPTTPTTHADINVSYIAPTTGVAAASGIDEENGFKLGLSHFGSTVDGHTIKVSYINTQGTPTIGLTDAKRSVSNHTEIVEGPLLANVIAGVAPYVMSHGIPENDLALVSPLQLADYQKGKLGFTSGWNPLQPPSVGAKWAYTTMHWTHVVTIADTYAFGWLTVGAFDNAYQKDGGTISKQIWVPNTVENISSYIAEVPATTQAVFVELLAGQDVSFFQSFSQYGLKGKVAILGNTTTTDQSGIGDAPKTATSGAYSVTQYCDDLPSQANQTFAQAYHNAYGGWPAYYSENGYTQAEILVTALKAVDGSAQNGKKLGQAMLSVKVTAPRGPMTISKQTYSPNQNVYICKVEIKTGALRQVPIKTFHDVPSYGTLSPSTWQKIFKANSGAQPHAG